VVSSSQKEGAGPPPRAARRAVGAPWHAETGADRKSARIGSSSGCTLGDRATAAANTIAFLGASARCRRRLWGEQAARRRLDRESHAPGLRIARRVERRRWATGLQKSVRPSNAPLRRHLPNSRPPGRLLRAGKILGALRHEAKRTGCALPEKGVMKAGRIWRPAHCCADPRPVRPPGSGRTAAAVCDGARVAATQGVAWERILHRQPRRPRPTAFRPAHGPGFSHGIRPTDLWLSRPRPRPAHPRPAAFLAAGLPSAPTCNVLPT